MPARYYTSGGGSGGNRDGSQQSQPVNTGLSGGGFTSAINAPGGTLSATSASTGAVYGSVGERKTATEVRRTTGIEPTPTQTAGMSKTEIIDQQVQQYREAKAATKPIASQAMYKIRPSTFPQKKITKMSPLFEQKLQEEINKRQKFADVLATPTQHLSLFTENDETKQIKGGQSFYTSYNPDLLKKIQPSIFSTKKEANQVTQLRAEPLGLTQPSLTSEKIRQEKTTTYYPTQPNIWSPTGLIPQEQKKFYDKIETKIKGKTFQFGGGTTRGAGAGGTYKTTKEIFVGEQKKGLFGRLKEFEEQKITPALQRILNVPELEQQRTTTEPGIKRMLLDIKIGGRKILSKPLTEIAPEVALGFGLSKAVRIAAPFAIKAITKIAPKISAATISKLKKGATIVTLGMYGGTEIINIALAQKPAERFGATLVKFPAFIAGAKIEAESIVPRYKGTDVWLNSEKGLTMRATTPKGKIVEATEMGGQIDVNARRMFGLGKKETITYDFVGESIKITEPVTKITIVGTRYDTKKIGTDWIRITEPKPIFSIEKTGVSRFGETGRIELRTDKDIIQGVTSQTGILSQKGGNVFGESVWQTGFQVDKKIISKGGTAKAISPNEPIGLDDFGNKVFGTYGKTTLEWTESLDLGKGKAKITKTKTKPYDFYVGTTSKIMSIETPKMTREVWAYQTQRLRGKTAAGLSEMFDIEWKGLTEGFPKQADLIIPGKKSLFPKKEVPQEKWLSYDPYGFMRTQKWKFRGSLISEVPPGFKPSPTSINQEALELFNKKMSRQIPGAEHPITEQVFRQPPRQKMKTVSDIPKLNILQEQLLRDMAKTTWESRLVSPRAITFYAPRLTSYSSKVGLGFKNVYSSKVGLGFKNVYSSKTIPVTETIRKPIFDTTIVPITETIRIPKQDIFQVPKSETFQIPKQDIFQVPKSETFQIPKQDTFQVPKSEIFQVPTYGKFFFPPWVGAGGGALGGRRGYGGLLKREFAYKPSLVAVVKKIRQKKKKIKTKGLTGLEIRPIQI